MTGLTRADSLVSIGVPTFNSAISIGSTLEGLMGQDHENLEILISDNCSSDGTADICEEITRGDTRVRVIRHPANVGAQANFRYLLSIAEGDFFMWAGSDDLHHQAFVLSNLERLLQDLTLSGSISLVRWTYRGVPGDLAAGTRPLLGTRRQNLAAFMRTARDNSRFYGLFRREALVTSFPNRDFYGFDLSVVAGTLRYGGHDRVEGEFLRRERSDPESYIRLVQQDEHGVVDRLLPLRNLTGAILTQNRGVMSGTALWWLAWRNVNEHFRYWATTDGQYAPVARKIYSGLKYIRHRAWESYDSRSP